jgi:hypothetical protein
MIAVVGCIALINAEAAGTFLADMGLFYHLTSLE